MTPLFRDKSARGVRALGLALALTSAGACSGGSLFGPTPNDGSPDATAPSPDVGMPSPDGDPNSPTFCGRGADVLDVVPPAGFCVKHYAQVGEPRALAFAPNGDLFVASPSRGTAGGATGGKGEIVVLFDDNHDGVAEQQVFLSGVDDVHGIALGGGFLYYSTSATVWKTPYVLGQRAAAGAPVNLGLPAAFGGGGRWTHGVALSKKGQLLASRGEYGTCGGSHGGEISSVGPTGALTKLASGFRNPMYLNCHFKDDVCGAMELGDDLHSGAREKMLIIHPGTNYGFPCCYTTGQPEMTGAACDDITKEESSFKLEDTPFGFDWEHGAWPSPFKNGLFVALHGSAYSSPPWKGAAIVYAPTSPTTHGPIQDWQPFLTGFGPDGSVLERPADVKFAPDGRLFFADDHSGRVFWVAPTGLAVPN